MLKNLFEKVEKLHLSTLLLLLQKNRMLCLLLWLKGVISATFLMYPMFVKDPVQ